MKHSRSKILLLLVLLASATGVFAGPRLNDLRIRVELQNNGDAIITETREMSIDSEGTECYIVIGNLKDSNIRDLTVKDETGREFENIGSWDIDRSRCWKEGKCGIVTKEKGYELCWGLGQSGNRTYITTYTVTNLVKAYPDADGFNYMFVAKDIKPLAQHVRLSIEPADTTHFSSSNTGIWGFRFRGSVDFENDSIVVVQTSEPFESASAMIVMCRFAKGMFQPAVEGEGTFEELKARALEGSDYTAEDDEMSDLIAGIFAALTMIFGAALAVVPLFYGKRKLKKKATKDLLYFRDIPMNGDLQEANKAMNALKYFGNDYNNLLSACILKLINLGAISIDKQLTEKGKLVSNFVIHELPQDQNLSPLFIKLHKIFKEAAGSDTVLEPKELRNYMRSSSRDLTLDDFIDTLHQGNTHSYYKDKVPQLREMFGLKKYLEDFSLLNERHVQEVTLWKDYMVWATLFGIADQVIKDMKKINPEYFNMDVVANQMADDMTLPMIYATMHRSTAYASDSKAAREFRASGGGGSSSWGGGGGFSGGGSGGGVR